MSWGPRAEDPSLCRQASHYRLPPRGHLGEDALQGAHFRTTGSNPLGRGVSAGYFAELLCKLASL